MKHHRARGCPRRGKRLRSITALGLWCLLASLALVMPLGQAQDARAEPVPTLTLGVFAYRPEAVMIEMWQPLVDYFNEQLDGELEVQLRALTQPDMQAALDDSELDLIFTNPAHYIELRTRNQLSGALATQVSLQHGQPTEHLGGVVIRRHDAEGPDTLEALPDYSIAVVGRQFLGGYAVPVGELKRLGIAPHHLTLMETGGSHDAVIDAVRAGRADVGLIRTGVLEAKLRDGSLPPGEISVVAPRHFPGFPFATSTRLYPEWAFVAHWSLPRDISKRIAALLFDLSPTHPAARTAGIHGFTIPADYASVEELMVSLRLPPFDHAPAFVWSDVWQRYWAAIVIGLSLAGVILLLLVIITLGYRRQRRLKKASGELATRLAWIIRGTRAGTWEWNAVTGENRCNRRWAEMLGYSLKALEPITRDTWLSLIHPDDVLRANQALQRHLSGDTPYYSCELRMRHRDGHWVWIYDRGQLQTRTPAGAPEWVVGTHIDVTDRHRLIETQQAWIQRFQEFSDNVPGVLFQFRLRSDGSSHFPFASPRLFEIYGCQPEEVMEDALPVFQVIHPDDLAAVERSIHVSAATLSPWRASYRVEHPRDGQRWLEGSATPSRQEDGCIIWHGYIRDITELKQHEQELEFIAYHDPLTGIPNRRLLSDRMSQAIAHALRSGETLAICMLDLDNFKPINDSYGHAAGDRVLIEIARRLSGLLRTEDSVARLGGDEFVLLLRNPDGDTVFQRVLEALRDPIGLGAAEVSVTGSLGVAMLDNAAPCDGDQLLRLADQAAYQAKSAGRDGYHIATRPVATRPTATTEWSAGP
ncbi:MAG: diguanylate cyclase domain-containing protein [Pseudomonadota bacterium]